MKQSQLARTIERLGGRVDWKAGKGSHIKAWCACGSGWTTIQNKLREPVVRRIDKQLAKPNGCFEPGWTKSKGKKDG